MAEQKEGSPSKKDQKKEKGRISRRQALGLGFKGLVAAMAMRGGLQTKEETVEAAGRAKRAVGGFLTGEKPAGEALKTLFGREPTFLHLVYRNLPSEDMDVAKREVFAEGQALADYDRVLRTSQYESLIRNTAKAHGVPEELLLGLAMYESEGQANYVSDKGCKGLTAMGDEIALKHNLKISDGDDDERLDPDKILPATASELREYFERLGDWGLAFQEWHVGRTQLYDELLRPYFASAHGEDLPSINVAPTDATSEAKVAADLETQKILELYKQKIDQYQVTVYHLFKNPQIQELVSSSGWEGTDHYLPRIMGSYAMFQGYNAVAIS